MVRIAGEIVITRPVEEVFDLVADEAQCYGSCSQPPSGGLFDCFP